jgi:hypothetical protein
VEGAQFRGHEQLDARIAEAYREFVESGKYTVASADDETGHHDVVTFTIQLVSASGDNAGDLAWAARVFLVLDDEEPHSRGLPADGEAARRVAPHQARPGPRPRMAAPQVSP